MRGRHTSDLDGRRWAPNAKHAALACAPVAALLVAVGAGGGGLLLGRPDIAAAGVGAGAVAFALEATQSRSVRRRQRQERASLRAHLHVLETEIAHLRRELAAAPSVLLPGPPPSHVTGPLPIVDTFDRAAAPATPRSLPILTANRRGLQSCAPGLPGMNVPALSAPAALGWTAEHAALAAALPALPVRPVAASIASGPPAGPAVPAVPHGPAVPFVVGLPHVPGLLPAQRPPATPITGLHLPPVVDPTLPRLEPGPSAPMPVTAALPLLAPGPSVPVDSHVDPSRQGLWEQNLWEQDRSGHDWQAHDRQAHDRQAHDPSGDERPGHAGEPVGASLFEPAATTVVDLRTVPDPAPASAAQPGAAVLDALVFSAIAEAEADAFTIALERPGRAAASLFEPVRRGQPAWTAQPWTAQPWTAQPWATTSSGAGHPSLDDQIDRAATDARTASRAMRPGIPPSPFFTPGAFGDEAWPQREEKGRHSA